MKPQDPRPYDPDSPPIRQLGELETLEVLRLTLERLEKLAGSDRITADEWRELGRPLGWSWQASGNLYDRETEVVAELRQEIERLESDLEFAETRVEDAWERVHGDDDHLADLEDLLEERDNELVRLRTKLGERAHAV